MPRIAVGTVQPGVDSNPLLWALLTTLEQQGHSLQAFRSRAAFASHEGARVITGRPARHLDTWLSDRIDCCQAFERGSSGANLAVVSGPFTEFTNVPASSSRSAIKQAGGSLDTLCDWLDLGRIAVVDVAAPHPCSLQRPKTLDAILLDGVRDEYDAIRWRTELEGLWGAPIIGYLDEATPLRKLVRNLAPGTEPSWELCAALAERLQRTLQFERLLQVARRSQPLDSIAGDSGAGNSSANDRPYALRGRPPLCVAVAYDESFSCYFPATLDRLEASGAVIRDFSPLRSEALPEDADLVYFGCGHPERYLEALAANHCLKQSLRTFAAAGGRIYGEGAGMAYLCRQIVLPDGRSASMSGLLPATARLVPTSADWEPVEMTFGASCWLADTHARLRGYRHSGWEIDPTGSMLTYARSPQQRFDMLGRENVIGSRLLVDFAPQTHLLRRFFSPRLSPALSLRS